MAPLARTNTHDELAAYALDHYSVLAPLLPAEVTTHMLLRAVDNKQAIADYFNETEDRTAKRAMLQLEADLGEILKEEAKCAAMRQKAEKHADSVKKSKKRKRKQEMEPPEPPQMTLEEAASIRQAGQATADERRRAKLLKDGWTGSFSVPEEAKLQEQPHQQLFFIRPAVTCGLFGAKLVNVDKYSVKLHFDGAALTKFEEIKRAGTPNTKTVDRLRLKSFELPTSGAPIKWVDFWGVLCGWAYRQEGAADRKLAMGSSKAQLASMLESEEAKITGRYEVRHPGPRTTACRAPARLLTLPLYCLPHTHLELLRPSRRLLCV